VQVVLDVLNKDHEHHCRKACECEDVDHDLDDGICFCLELLGKCED